ncbi:MAG: protein kinase [Vicinamibacterales bacterium]
MSPAEEGRSRVLTATVRIAVALCAMFVGVHLLVTRPTAFPAGAGFTMAGGAAWGPLADWQALRLARPPDLSRPLDARVAEVMPGSAAARAGLRAGDLVGAIADGRGRTLRPAAVRDGDAPAALAAWRTAWWLDVRRPFTLTVERPGGAVPLAIVPQWFPDVPSGTTGPWLRRHLGGMVHMLGALAAAVALVALRVRGTVAALMTLTMAVNIAVGGALAGGEAWLPALVRDPVVLLAWLLVPLGFPIVALTVLNFPSPAALLTRWRWLPAGLVGLATPLIVANGLAALYLVGVDAVAAPLGWLAARPLLWTATFILAVAANAAIVVEGFARYRRNPDVNERRRIMVVVYTGVPGALAWAISEMLPVAGSLLVGRPVQLPWELTVILTAAMLLPAVGLPYAVAVRQVFSPRIVLRRSLQYALARRTLTMLTLLPAVPLVVSLVWQRDRSLTEIVTGRPLFYAVGLGLLVLARRYHVAAGRWLDRRFFRAEYDAREILMSLAGRLPFETDPGELVALVMQHLDAALHPESVAVLAEVAPGRFEALGARPAGMPPLPSGGGLLTLLRWSREPLDVALDDPRASVVRLPDTDRAWLAGTGVRLLVPLVVGSPSAPDVMGLLALGAKQSDEPYSPEDRALLAAIAAQMAVGLDVSRVRQRATAAATAGHAGASEAATAAAAATLGVCPRCQRATALGCGTCPDDGTPLAPVPGLPPVVDGKYRVDALVGRGGMGAVFRARDVRLDRDVAIKVVRAELLTSPDARGRFRREAQILARLQHPAVVAVYDYGTLADGAAYLVMQFVRGEDLRRRLRRGPPLDPSQVAAILTGVATGVQAAHDVGVFHRDLKPENVLLREDGGGPTVLDFGVAKAAPVGADGTMTAGATVVGTPAYMAPEQLRGEPVDGRADVFSLGVMAFEMLTGRLPFGAGSFVDIGVAHAAGRVADAERLPAPLRDVVLQALATRAADRPATPAAFADAVRAHAGRDAGGSGTPPVKRAARVDPA